MTLAWLPPSRPTIGVLCSNEVADRPIQSVASRFVEPLASISRAVVLLGPAVVEAADVRTIADRLDGLLLIGSRNRLEGRARSQRRPV